MAILIDLEPVKSLIAQPDTYAQVADNPGFSLYWRSMGRDPNQVAAGLAGTDAADRAAALDEAGQEAKSLLGCLARISGVSIEQLVLRHLPGDPFVDAQVVFVPGGDLVLAAEGNTVVINVFALEQQGNKLFLGEFPLLSLLANRIHQLYTKSLAPEQPVSSCAAAIRNFLLQLLRVGSATLFFTLPVSGSVYKFWQQAEQRRDGDVQLLRHYLRLAGGEDKSPLVLIREMEQAFGLSGTAALAAKYPLGTWMCQVIEGAFGRSYLVDLLLNPADFLEVFEQARRKFGLADKYSLGSLA